jgi:hypothetical protein
LEDARVAHQWSLNWANGKSGILGVPTIGEFKNGRGVFVDQESFDGHLHDQNRRIRAVTCAASQTEDL